MGENLFVNGNICVDRVRIGLALHKPPLIQSDLDRKLNLMGMEMTTLIVSRIEKKQQHNQMLQRLWHQPPNAFPIQIEARLPVFPDKNCLPAPSRFLLHFLKNDA